MYIIVVQCVQSMMSSAACQTAGDESSTFEQLQQMKRKNKEIYEFAVNKLLKL